MFIDRSVGWMYMSMFVICQSDQDVHHVFKIGKFYLKSGLREMLWQL